MNYLAHSSEKKFGLTESIKEHSVLVAELASLYAKDAGRSKEARDSALGHDGGKYGALSQDVLCGRATMVDHWSAGARYLLEFAQRNGVCGAIAIRGHHAGLNSCLDSEIEAILKDVPYPLDRRLSGDYSTIKTKLQSHYGTGGICWESVYDETYKAAGMLDVRMLFSALVDADWTATFSHFHRDDQTNRIFPPASPPLQAEIALAFFKEYLESLKREKKGMQTHIAQMRDRLMEHCAKMALQEPGLFTLTAPTGSGKTLSMLRFALEHAKTHGLKRIIVVLPYLNIIEQTSQIYEGLLAQLNADGQYLMQDHSLSNRKESDDSDKGDIQIGFDPNWQQPLIITTSVKFFESLFASKPGACRKLHALAKSIILFDEAQTLPQRVVVPTLAALSHLCSQYNSTVVFASATQPAFDHFDDDVKKLARHGWCPTEIVPKDERLFDKIRRVSVEWPKLYERVPVPMSINEVVARMIQRGRSLCIVNTKKQAKAIYKELLSRGETPWCITTDLCSAHRRKVLKEVKEALDQPDYHCLCVATQCVEAGVDIDFPQVLRAWAPLPALVQAAGRCNREGASTLGEFIVFILEEESFPDKAYQKAAKVAEEMFVESDGTIDIYDPTVYKRYYERLYYIDEGTAKEDKLLEGLKAGSFKEVSKYYKIIDSNTVNVLVPYEAEEERFNLLAEQARKNGVTREWIHEARDITVSIFEPKKGDPAYDVLEPIKSRQEETWFILTKAKYYCQMTGLVLPKESTAMIG